MHVPGRLAGTVYRSQQSQPSQQLPSPPVSPAILLLRDPAPSAASHTQVSTAVHGWHRPGSKRLDRPACRTARPTGDLNLPADAASPEIRGTYRRPTAAAYLFLQDRAPDTNTPVRSPNR